IGLLPDRAPVPFQLRCPGEQRRIEDRWVADQRISDEQAIDVGQKMKSEPDGGGTPAFLHRPLILHRSGSFPVRFDPPCRPLAAGFFGERLGLCVRYRETSPGNYAIT